MKIYEKITDLIGGTPLLELKNYETANDLQATVVAKLEYFNPAGSVKIASLKLCLTMPRPKGAAFRFCDHRTHFRQYRHWPVRPWRPPRGVPRDPYHA